MNLVSRKYRIRGLVQGVGFRPYVAELAERMGLSGEIRNSGGSVFLSVSGEEKAVDEMIHRLFLKDKRPESEAGSGAVVDSAELISDEVIDRVPKEGFVIHSSDTAKDGIRILPPDIATCIKCERELFDKTNRRYRHPFISCTSCGPRYTIMKSVPYDRATTTMADFPLCSACESEYIYPKGRRRHAQTICCPDCGPKVYAYPSGSDEAAVESAVSCILSGGIVAVKDIGGYHFAHLASDDNAANRLRSFKNRNGKAFAVMFKDITSIKECAFVSETEERLLQSSARPVVLLKQKYNSLISPEVLGDSERVGAMLPCNPIQLLILNDTGPLVMTSANKRGEPIITSDEEMIDIVGHSGICDMVLYHDRPILQGLDDSVLQVVKTGDREIVQFLRRARGYVPTPVFLKEDSFSSDLGDFFSEDSLASGGDLKSVFALGKGNAVYLSGHFGDLSYERAVEKRVESISHMKSLLGVAPVRIAKDMHPSYVSGRMDLNDFSDTDFSGSVLPVQHHHAHILSVMAEHGLSGPFLGVAFDGTGYGADGTIWGGEFLLCEGKTFSRVGCLLQIEMIGGDVSAKFCDAAAYAWLFSTDRGVASLFEEKSSKSFLLWRQALKNHIGTVKSSSMGRLFDAAAAVLGLSSENAYEGQAALRLQMAAERFLDKNSKAVSDDSFRVYISKIHFAFDDESPMFMDPGELICFLFLQRLSGEDVEFLAYAFHKAVAAGTVALCRRIKNPYSGSYLPVALSGGCMQNSLFLSMLICELEQEGVKVYVNEKVPPGDGGLALGQIYALYQNRM